LLGGFAAFLALTDPHGEGPYGDAGTRYWVADKLFLFAGTSSALVLCVLLVDDIVGYFERRAVARRVRRWKKSSK